jgi:amino acid transporter
MLLQTLHDILIGPPLPTQRALQERLNKVRALAALSPDALSSITYANQEIFLGLVVAGAAGLVYSRTIALVIAALLGFVALSYSQTIIAYPIGGGSYTVARENLGTLLGLVAAAALVVDYVLVAAVSLTAGAAAAASAFPALWSHRTLLALALLVFITLANMRGLREAGTLMAVPVYLFLSTHLVLIAYGVARAVIEGPSSYATTAASLPAEPLTLFLVLHAFSSGCTMLTGVEAISNGVPVFNPPESRNANQTMAAMTVLMAVLFLGTTGLTQHFAIVAGPEETILSALTRHILGSGPLYLIVQASKLLVLMVAANTSFVGFPRVAYLMAQDRFAPRQLLMLGDRLVFSNSILLLSGLAAALIVVFGGDTHALIPLLAVGAYLAFTLSQGGMVVHWVRERGRAWHIKAAINGLGAAATAATLFIVGVSRFIDGAWIAMLAIPLLVLGFLAIHAHYQETRRELTLKGLPPSLSVPPSPRIVLPISGVHRGVIEALRYALSISDHVTAVYVEIEPGTADEIRERWQRWGLGVPLEIIPSPYRTVVGPFIDFLNHTDQEHNDGQLATVLMPEIVPAKWWQFLLHNQTAWILKLALLYRRRRFGKVRTIIDVPMHLRR